MANSSKSTLVNKIKSEYNKKLKDLEVKLTATHKELNLIEREIAHETKRVDHLNISKLKSRKAELNMAINVIHKETKKIKKEMIKKLRKL